MENNPYTPPAAEVADPAADWRPRPRAVNIALALIGTGLVIQLLLQLWLLQLANFRTTDRWQTAWAVSLFVLYVFLCHQLAQGRSWPRAVLLILAVGGFASTCFAFGYALNAGLSMIELLTMPVVLFNRIVPMVLNFVALHLLFYSGASWFREQRDPGRPGQ